MKQALPIPQPTAARVRIYDGYEGGMRIGLNQVAEAYFSLKGLSDWLQQSTDSRVSSTLPSNPEQSPYVSRSLEVCPPLSQAQLMQLGEQLVSGSMLADEALVTPDGINVTDNRGHNAPDSQFDRGLPIAQLLPKDMPDWQTGRVLSAA